MNENHKKSLKKITVVSMLALNTIPLFSAVLETQQVTVQAADKKSPNYQNVYVDKNGAITANNDGGKNRVATNADDNRTGGNNAANRKSGSTGSGNSNSSGSSGGTDNPTTIPMNEYIKTDHYWAWLQYWGPWAKGYGKNGNDGQGTGGTNWGPPGFNNVGCVATSEAIQMARGGFTKSSSGDIFNPSAISVNAPLTYSAGGLHMSAGPQPFGGSSMSVDEVMKECKKITSAGNYPLLRMNGGEHTVAYWKPSSDGKSPLFYDPSRMKSGNYAKAPYTKVSSLSVTGKGAKKFNPNDPGPSGEGPSNSSDDSSSDKDSSGSGSGSGGGGGGSSSQLPIKPIFNPFYSPTIHYIPADEQSGEDQRQSQIMQAADGDLPTVLGWVRNIVGFLAIAYAAYAVISILFAIGDLWMGGIIQTYFLDKTRGSMTGGLFFPGGKFMGVDTGVTGNGATMAIIKAGFRRYTLVLIVSTIVASGAMSWIVATSISLVGMLFGAS